MTTPARTTPARELLLDAFRWTDGHGDIWPAFRDAGTLAALIRDLVEPFRGAGITAVCGIESRGFLLGGAAAVALGAGFAAVRKGDGLFPGEKLTARTQPDYRGLRHELRLRRSSLGPGDAVLFVDDWIETGSQARAVRELVAAAGARLVGCAVIVDEVRPDAREGLGTFHALMTADELPAP